MGLLTLPTSIALLLYIFKDNIFPGFYILYYSFTMIQSVMMNIEGIKKSRNSLWNIRTNSRCIIMYCLWKHCYKSYVNTEGEIISKNRTWIFSEARTAIFIPQKKVCVWFGYSLWLNWKDFKYRLTISEHLFQVTGPINVSMRNGCDILVGKSWRHKFNY